MSSFDAETLYRLLPAIHRVRDAEQGYPLKQLVEVIATQVAVVEEDLEQLYDNHFVETAASWALPYLADLLGVRGLSGRTARTRTPRAEVGHTIAYRRRKGTAAMLELLARDVTGWPARAVEFFERLATTQSLNHLRPKNRAWVSLRDAATLEGYGGPFEAATRTVEVRRIEPSRGRWNIPNVGLFLWRLRAGPIRRSPLVAAGLPGGRHFRFHPLGMDLALYNRPETEDELAHLAEPLNVPMPITRRRLCGEGAAPSQFHPSGDYYGPDRSLLLERRHGAHYAAIAASELVVADLDDVRDGGGTIVAWDHQDTGASLGKILLDPMRGRVLFPAAPADPVYGTAHQGVVGDIGGGEYGRAQAGRALPTRTVAATDPLALQTVSAALAALGGGGGIIEIADSARYVENIAALPVGSRQLELRAADQRRPALIIDPSPGTALDVSGDPDGSLTLDGLLLAGATIRVTGRLGRLVLRHCTLLPGLQVGPDGQATLGPALSILVQSPNTSVELTSCIVQSLQVGPGVSLSIATSIVDGGDTTRPILTDVDGHSPGGVCTITDSTLRGKVSATELPLASNSIFFGELASGDDPVAWPAPLLVRRRQQGCVRFCYLPAGARVPRRHQCLPRAGRALPPVFTSLRYGDAAYGQLGLLCPPEFRNGADDESELGAFHDLFQSQREAHLRARLAEYLRFGLEAGVFYAS